MVKDRDGQIGALNPLPLSSWFVDPVHCFASKTEIDREGLLNVFPLHQKSRPLATGLYRYWKLRYIRQSNADALRVEVGGGVFKGLPPRHLVKPKRMETVDTTEPSEELSHRELFEQIFQLLLNRSGAIPESKGAVFVEMVNLITASCSFVDSWTVRSGEKSD
jgi:hypothetical protein